MAEKDHYVHFSSASGVSHNNIVLQPLRHGHLDAHLGFLQVHHTYHVEFSVPWNKCVLHSEDKTLPLAIPYGEPNPNCHLIEVSPDRDDLRLKIELVINADRCLKEQFQITCCEKGSPLTIYLKGRILGEDQGTPILRNGIRIVGRKDQHKSSRGKHYTQTTEEGASASSEKTTDSDTSD